MVSKVVAVEDQDLFLETGSRAINQPQVAHSTALHQPTPETKQPNSSSVSQILGHALKVQLSHRTKTNPQIMNLGNMKSLWHPSRVTSSCWIQNLSETRLHVGDGMKGGVRRLSCARVSV
jgi:hypothetical protein